MSPRNTQFSREEIIEAAFALVREAGWTGFSVQAVAKAIGGSTMPIYSQFSNVRELEDAVCLKALELLKERMVEVRSGDKWIDHAISWVKFAVDEKHLYSSLWDGRNVELCMKCGEEISGFISGELADYPLFAKLSREEVAMITLSRRLFAQKLAYWLNKDPDYLRNRGIETEDFIRRTSMALYDGFMLQFRAEEEVNKTGR
ncbi:MAG: TetR/AcrR family transcriptional regulator [Geobacter sp.]|nr:TetR/AcrR family transcriptional regulator [Geobacter sp.]